MSASVEGSPRTALIAGASRGLGYAMAAELVDRGWHVIGTVRGEGRTEFHDLAEKHRGAVEIEALDINEPQQIAALRHRLSGRLIDLLFVNAGTTTHDEHVRVGAVSTDEFVRVMLTNALSPMRVIEALADLVPADGLIGAMSSGQGSIANNETGMREVYRSSKAALNMFMRSFAARETEASRAMVLMAPGWIRTDLGGSNAPFTMEEAVPMVIDVLLSAIGTPGLRYLDRFGKTVPW
jgi:NAD(P)-dependent dehydrogenase (short-subunit alcohol dehydrogenase family)